MGMSGMILKQIREAIEKDFADELRCKEYAYAIEFAFYGVRLTQQICESICNRLSKKCNGLTSKELSKIEYKEWEEMVYKMLGEYEDDIAKIQKLRDEENEKQHPIW